LARDLLAAGAPIIGTSPDSIDLAEDRERFQQLIEKLGLRQPPNRTARNQEEALQLAEQIGYPLVVRPSYVLGGRAMEIVHDQAELSRYMKEAVSVSNDSPVLLDRFLNDATEVDVDAICDGEDVIIGGIMEHIEEAGVHSGDSACSLPPFSLDKAVRDELARQVKKMAKGLGVVGLMNTQFAVQGDTIFVLEVNPRASRTVPFVSKATGVQLAKVAARCMAGQTLAAQNMLSLPSPNHFSVKESVFPFAKFPGVDILLGPEMKSTGEVMGSGQTFGEAFFKASLGASVELPQEGQAFISVRDKDKEGVIEVARRLLDSGFTLLATDGTQRAISDAGLACQRINKMQQGQPHIVDEIKNNAVSLIVNTTEGRQAISDSYQIRQQALRRKVAYTTTLSGATAMCAALKHSVNGMVYRLDDIHKETA
jgi:carbamoyl-phosphate synthase large subunit